LTSTALEKRIAVVGLSFVALMMAFLLYFLFLAWPLFQKGAGESQRPSAATDSKRAAEAMDKSLTADDTDTRG
jgi:hypothetical protein